MSLTNKEIMKSPQKNGYYICFSGSSNCNGVTLDWGAIPVRDVFDGYYYMTRMVAGKEEKTKKRRNYLAIFLSLIGFEDYEMSKAARWHAAEHKVINLLTQGLPLTLEEARKAPSAAELCGNENKLLSDPSDSQLLEVLEVGKKIKNQVEKHPLFSFESSNFIWWIQRRKILHTTKKRIAGRKLVASKSGQFSPCYRHTTYSRRRKSD